MRQDKSLKANFNLGLLQIRPSLLAKDSVVQHKLSNLVDIGVLDQNTLLVLELRDIPRDAVIVDVGYGRVRVDFRIAIHVTSRLKFECLNVSVRNCLILDSLTRHALRVNDDETTICVNIHISRLLESTQNLFFLQE